MSGATMVVVDGPRFSSRAESRWFAAAGWSLVNMTGMPEAALARELAMCYTSLALVTDVDAGLAREEAVSQSAVFADHIERLRKLVSLVAERLPHARTCPCAAALDGLDHGLALPSP